MSIFQGFNINASGLTAQRFRTDVISENIANVKTMTIDFVDYIQLGKINGEWKIYNVVWEPNNNQKR